MSKTESCPILSQDVSQRDLKEKQKILALDDDPMILRALRRILSKDKNLLFEGVKSVREAIHKIENGYSPDFIFCDIAMPGETGEDFYEWVKEKRCNLIDRITFLTGGGTTYEMREFINSMDNKGRVISKPFEIQVIQNRVRKAS